MIWGPFVLALVLGLIVSAGLYFAYLWPSVEPEDPAEGLEPPKTAKTDPAPNATADAPAESAKA